MDDQYRQFMKRKLQRAGMRFSVGDVMAELDRTFGPTPKYTFGSLGDVGACFAVDHLFFRVYIRPTDEGNWWARVWFESRKEDFTSPLNLDGKLSEVVGRLSELGFRGGGL